MKYKDQKFIGHSLSPENMLSLHDTYKEINPANEVKFYSSFGGILLPTMTQLVLLHKWKRACLQVYHGMRSETNSFIVLGFDVVLLSYGWASANLKLLCEKKPRLMAMTNAK